MYLSYTYYIYIYVCMCVCFFHHLDFKILRVLRGSDFHHFGDQESHRLAMPRGRTWQGGHGDVGGKWLYIDISG